MTDYLGDIEVGTVVSSLQDFFISVDGEDVTSDFLDNYISETLLGYLRTCIAVGDLENAEAISRALAYHLDLDWDAVVNGLEEFMGS